MKNQLTEYNSHTSYLNYLNKLNDDELKDLKRFSQVINVCIENMEIGKIYKHKELTILIKNHMGDFKTPYKRVASAPITGYLFCKNDNIIWDNCTCGEIGSFTLKGENNERN